MSSESESSSEATDIELHAGKTHTFQFWSRFFRILMLRAMFDLQILD